jgi:hypothetical protein
MRTGQIIQFPLQRGLSEDLNPKGQPMSALKSGVNIRWPREGVIGKRFGAAPLATPSASTGMSSFGTVRRFIPRADTLSITDGDRIATYDPVTESWLRGSRVSPVSLKWSTLVDDQTGVASADAAISGDLMISAWVTGDPTRRPEFIPTPDVGGVCLVEVKNVATGEYFKRPVRLSLTGARHVRVLVAGGYALVLYSTGALVSCVSINLTTAAQGSTQILAGDVANTANVRGRFDAILLASGVVAIAYEKDLGGLKIAAKRFTVSSGSLSLATAADIGPDTTLLSMRIVEDPVSARIYVLYSHLYTGTQWDIATERYRVRLLAVGNVSLGSSLSAATVDNDFAATQVSIKLISTNVLAAAWSGVALAVTVSTVPVAGARVASLRSAKLTSTGSKTTGTYSRSTGLEILSDIFAPTIAGAARYYAYACDARYAGTFVYDTADAATLLQTPSVSSYLVELDMAGTEADNAPHRIVGKVDHDIGGVFQTGRVAAVPGVDSETFYALLPFQATANPVSFNWRCGLRLVRMTADVDLIADPWRNVAMGGEAYIQGAHFQAWDGRTVFDYGMRAPYVVDAGNVWLPDTANGLMANGTYIYQATAGYRSRAGILHRGPLSITKDIDVTSPNSNTGSVYGVLGSASIDGKQTSETGFGADSAGCVFLDLYRSEADGSALYKLTYEPRYNTLLNTPTSQILEFHDKRADEDITDEAADESPGGSGALVVPDIALATRPLPYTSGGDLEDCQPPAPYTVHLQGGRIFIVTGSRREIWFSKDAKENPGIAPGFSPVQIEVYEHDITALGALDDKRIVFWERGIWYIVGDGPNVSGTDNRFSPALPIQTDVGCTNPRSVVAWPGGLVFQNGSDLYNLSRGLEVSWIGKDVTETLEAYPTLTSAVLVATENELRFTCNGEGGGIVVVFDYQRGTWSTRTYEALDGEDIADAYLHDGAYLLTGGGLILREDTTTHLDTVDDADAFVESTAELESISPAGPVSWQRVRIVRVLGESLSNHSLTVDASRDWAETYEQTASFAAGSPVTTPSTHERAEVALTIQRRQAVGLRIADAAPANTTTYPLGNGAGFQLEGIALLVQPRPGMPRDTTTRRSG